MRVPQSVPVSIVAVVVLGAAIAFASRVLIHQFDAIELNQTADKATQTVRALEADLNQLALSARDYGEWDDAQAYIVNRSAQFLQANFSYASLDGMHVDVAAILDREGTLLYGAALDEAGGTIRTDIPSEVMAFVRQFQPKVTALRDQPSSQRLVRTAAGLLAFCVVEITRSDQSAPTGAMLFFGRFLDADEIDRMRHTSQLPAELRVLTTAEAATAIAQPPSSARMVDASTIEGMALLHDWKGVPVARIEVLERRDIGALGRRTTFALMGAIALLIVGCGALFNSMIAKLRRHWKQHAALLSRQQRILASLDELIALADPRTGQLIDGNASLLRTLDYTERDLEYLSVKEIFVDLPDAVFGTHLPDAPGSNNCRLRARDGHLVECEVNLTHLAEREQPLLCIVARDLTNKRLAEQRLQEKQDQLLHSQEHDGLTGLPNRNYLHARLADSMADAAARDCVLALLHIDIDYFKHVNDLSGRAAGDRILSSVAQRLQAEVGPADLVVRMGGDEFMIVAALPDSAAAKSLAQRLLASIRLPIQQDAATVDLTASIGGAIYPQDGLDAETLLKHADIALFQAKETGRDRFQAFANDMNVRISEQVFIEQALRRAIDTEQIYVEYQPVVDLHTGLLVSFEALSRWKHPELGVIPPGRFIPVAERTGLVVQLGAQVVRHVIAQLRQWQDAGLTLAPIAINVAAIQFERTDFANFVHEAALNCDVDPRWLAFEITESALLQNSDKHIVAIDTLRHAGSRVYIDDFGTGFSNLSYLKTLPVDAVKIDQSFVRSIETDASDAAIVTSIVTVARQLRLDTIAEGIETAAHADRLRQLGCRFGQGYYFSKPMPAALCRALLEQLGAARRFTETVKIRAFKQVTG